MDPKNSRAITLAGAREQLARSIARLEGLARHASEVLARATKEKLELEARVLDLTARLEQERSLYDQREKLFLSDKVESKSASAQASELKREMKSLEAKHEQQALIMEEQLTSITRLESALSASAEQLTERNSRSSKELSEAATSLANLSQIEAKLAAVVKERDELKANLHQHEREEARWVLKLTKDEALRATKAIDAVLDRVNRVEASVHAQAEEQEMFANDARANDARANTATEPNSATASENH